MRKPQSLCLLLIFVLVLIFIQQGWVIGLGMCNCCGSSCYTCPTEAQIEQGYWDKEISEFLYCDDCFPSLSPYKSSIPASNQPTNGTASYWMDKG
ncbi:MAG: hypothetical protein WB392_07325, partial [Methanotrichaceae archaeon]